MRSWNRVGVIALFAMAAVAVVGCAGNSSPSAPSSFNVGGSITGLTASGLVLQDNKGDNLTVGASSTSFTFATKIAAGAGYAVTVLTQPAGENCSVTGGTGTASAQVTSVSVACIAAYAIGGPVFGLNASGLVLQDNGGNNLTVSSTATSYNFVFPGTVPNGGAPYMITILTSPTGQACTIANPTGTAAASVNNVSVSCSTNPTTAYDISGTVSGLTGSGLVLQNQAGINDDDLLPVSTNGNFMFVDPIAAGGSYSVSVLDQPAGRNCTINNGVGVATANVTNVNVICLGEFAWMGGSNLIVNFQTPAGVYGTLGTASPTNIPGGREQALSWTDASGKAWLFGGYGEDSTGTGYGGQLNDLWTFDETLGTHGEWTWVGGSNITPASSSFGAAGPAGTYGTLGVAAPTNQPGGREQVASWLDTSGNLWMFGGEGQDANQGTGQLNDLWMFNPTTSQWTWMGGSSTVPFLFGGQFGVYGTQGIAAAMNIPGGRYGSSTWKDSAGNFWLFGGDGSDVTGAQGYLNDMWKYTPGTGLWTWVGGSSIITGQGQSGVYGTQGTPDAANIPGGRDAGMSWTDGSGNFWLFGGIGIDANGNFTYLNDLWKFTPSTGLWTWIGGSTTAPQGSQGVPGNYGLLGVAAASNVPGGRFSAVTWTDKAGNFWLFGGDGYDSTDEAGYLDDLWMYTPSATGDDTGKWTWEGGNDTVGRTGGQIGVYGTLGTLGNNIPGGRFGSTGWVDASGSLWLFGGDAYDAVGSQGNLNDLWVYKP